MNRGKNTAYDTQAKQGCPHGHNPDNCDICITKAIVNHQCVHGINLEQVCKRCEDDERSQRREE